MNYLAHFLCTQNRPSVLVGQFISDAIKGRDYENYTGELRGGILLHRHIDQATESSPHCKQLRELIRHDVGLWSPVAIDMYLDYALANHWHLFHSLPLQQFAQWCYRELNAQHHLLPERIQYTLHYMAKGDWLTSYQSIEGTQKALTGLSQRVKNGHGLQIAAEKLPDWVNPINQCFSAFFPPLFAECDAKILTFATDI